MGFHLGGVVDLADAFDEFAVGGGDAVASLEQEHGVHRLDMLLGGGEAVSFVLESCLQGVAQTLSLHGELREAAFLHAPERQWEIEGVSVEVCFFLIESVGDALGDASLKFLDSCELQQLMVDDVCCCCCGGLDGGVGYVVEYGLVAVVPDAYEYGDRALGYAGCQGVRVEIAEVARGSSAAYDDDEVWGRGFCPDGL